MDLEFFMRQSKHGTRQKMEINSWFRVFYGKFETKNVEKGFLRPWCKKFRMTQKIFNVFWLMIQCRTVASFMQVSFVCGHGRRPPRSGDAWYQHWSGATCHAEVRLGSLLPAQRSSPQRTTLRQDVAQNSSLASLEGLCVFLSGRLPQCTVVWKRGIQYLQNWS